MSPARMEIYVPSMRAMASMDVTSAEVLTATMISHVPAMSAIPPLELVPILLSTAIAMMVWPVPMIAAMFPWEDA